MKNYFFILWMIIMVGEILHATAIVVPSTDISKIEIQGATTVVRSTGGKIFVYNNEDLVLEYAQKGYSDFLIVENTLFLWTVTDATKILEYDMTTYKKKSSHSIDVKLEALFELSSGKLLVVAEQRKYTVIATLDELSKPVDWQKSTIPLWREIFWMHNGNIYYYHAKMVYRFYNGQFQPHLHVPNSWYVHHGDRIALRSEQEIYVYTLETKELLEVFSYHDVLKMCSQVFVYSGKIIGVSDKKVYIITSQGITTTTYTDVVRYATEKGLIFESDAYKISEDLSQFRIARCLQYANTIFVFLHEGRAFGSNKTIIMTMD